MSEKLFVIMEVLKRAEGTVSSGPRYEPVHNTGDELPYREFMILHPSRIIPASRLRYGAPNAGERYFSIYNQSTPDKKVEGFIVAGCDKGCDKGLKFLILDPPEEEKSDLQVLLESAPDCVNQRVKKWVESIVAYLEKGHLEK